MSDIDVAALRAAAEGATPGPWVCAEQTHGEWYGIQSQQFALGNVFLAKHGAHIAAANPAVVLELLDRLAAAEGAAARLQAAIPQTLDAHAEDSGGLGCICGWWAPDDKDDASYDTHLAGALLAAIGHTDSTRVVQMRDEAAIARALAAPPGVPHIPPSLRRANEREQP